MTGGLLVAVTIVFASACASQATPKTVLYPRPSAGGTGSVQLALPSEIAWGRVWVDGESIQAIDSATNHVVIHRLPLGIHEIGVSGPDGRLVGARVKIEPGVTTRATAVDAVSPAGSEVARARPPPVDQAPVRPCSGLRFASRLVLILPAFGGRACLPIGRHATIEATATTLLAHFLADVGFTIHPGSNDAVPFVALRGGIYANIVVGGYAVTPSAVSRD